MSSETYVFKTSRLEVADAVSDAFTGAAMAREQLVAHAEEAHASTEVLLALSCLRRGKAYLHLRDLWPDLPDLPVERG